MKETTEINLKKVPLADLQAELARRAKNQKERTLAGCKETCKHCNKQSSLTDWCKIESYWYEDDVYTTSFHHQDKYYHIVCPHCLKRTEVTRGFSKWDSEKKKDPKRLEHHHRLGVFEGVGKFRAEYSQVDNQFFDRSDYNHKKPLPCPFR